MGNLTIWILPSGLVYEPPPPPECTSGPPVRRGEEVIFRLGPGVSNATVQFDGASCFDPPGPYLLNSASLLTSSIDRSVLMTAAFGPYSFHVDIEGPGIPPLSERKGGELETKKGGIDVTTDPPKDPKK